MPHIFARFRLVAFALAACIFEGTALGAEANPAQARTWDAPVTIGAGGWRGVQPVKTKKDKKHHIEAGALMEGARFDGEGGVQWTVDGAILRDCHFAGDLGFRFEAKDTVLEGCKLRKSGGWFVGWAGTRWKLTNCLITRSFLPKDIGLHDYSVRAVDCTFVGVELPALSHKNDPSSYMGKEDVKFAHCRFVGCDITESVLAASVDCQFESCRFRLEYEKKPDKPDKWETAKTAVNVNAYLVGEEARANHTHGQLNVSFFKAEPGATAGCTLPIARAGARVVLPAWARQITAWSELGTSDKAASDLSASTGTPAANPAQPVAAAPPAAPSGKTISGANAFLNLPGAVAPKAPTVAAKPPTSPAAPTAPLPPVAAGPGSAASIPPAPATVPALAALRKVDDLFAALPRTLVIGANGKLTPEGIRQATLHFENAAVGSPAALRVAVEQIRPFMDEGYDFLLSSIVVPMRLQGCNVSARIEARFRANQSAQRARLVKGAAVNLRGTVGKVAFGGMGLTPELIVTLEEASLE